MPPLTDEQQKAIASIDEHVLVSAGAGSGKTFVLVERYIRVLELHPQAGINDIIAVTYTKKAAEEMRSRLKARLKSLIETSDGEIKQRWNKCLAEVEFARIGTIHSLCDSILKNYPSEAGIDPGFEILDDLERAELLAESIDKALHMLIEKPLDNFFDLLDYPIESVRNWLGAFLRSPLKYKESRQRFGNGTIKSIRALANDFIKADMERALNDLESNAEFNTHSAYLKDTPWSDRDSKLGILQEDMLHCLEIVLNKEENTCHQRWQAVQSIAAMDSARNAGGPKATELRDCMRHIRKEAKSIAARHKTELNQSDERAFALIRAVLSVTDDALRNYELLKRQHQKLDFDDLIERCQNMFAQGSSHALKQLSKNLQAVLVDEFQDTNWIQAKLLTALAGNKAKLFLIGDDKQSIYKFQGADVGTFNACKTYVGSLLSDGSASHESTADHYGLPRLSGNGALLTLSQSFRSHPEIVNFVNHLFRALFDQSAGEEEYRSRFQALRPARTRSQQECQRIEVIYTPPPDVDSANVRNDIDRSEANLTAAWIKQKVASGTEIFDKEQNAVRPINYSDFAILLQANGDFAGIEAALSQAGIPYVSIAGSGFLDKQEVYDLENMLKWLSCPQDSHALFAVLRSPMFGFSDDILHEMKSGTSASLWQCLAAKAQEEGNEDLRVARRMLQNLLRTAGSLCLPDTVREIIQTTSYDVVLLSTSYGKQKSRNVWKFLSLANQYRHMGITEFLQSLKAMRELGVKNLTDAPLAAENAVKIMTIHKSKGLEFAAVALPRLGRSALQYPDKLLFGKDLAIAFDCTRDSEEEKKRLLYVATTRARDFLALFITPRCKRGTNFGKWLIEALHLPDADSVPEDECIQIGHGDEACSVFIYPGSTVVPLASDEDIEDVARIRTDTRPPGVDYTLLEYDDKNAEHYSFNPVPWQHLLRVCPTDDPQNVHATIAGNYFHLLMSKLGPQLELPSEKERKALLLHHEVSIHDPGQQEHMLKESERLLITFRNSKLHSIMKSARRCLQEYSYLIVRDKREEELRPDLIIEDVEGQWHIVDFKTDHFDHRQLSKQIAHHQPQLAKYVGDLDSLLGIKAKAWIYFAQYGKLEAVDTGAPVQLSLF